MLALGRVITRDLSFQAKKSPVVMLLFVFLKLKSLICSMGVWELQPSRYFLCPRHSCWQNWTQPAIQPFWVTIKTVSRTFISAIKAINWFLGHVLTQWRDGFCYSSPAWSNLVLIPCLIKIWYSLGVQREGKQPLSTGGRWCSSYSSW